MKMRPATLLQRPKLFLALFLLVFFISLCTSRAEEHDTGLLLTFKSTNFDQMIGTGVVKKISPSWAFVADGYTGGGTTGVQTQALLLLNLSPKSTLFFAAGPELSVTQQEPSADDKLAYIQAASTFGFNYHATDYVCLFVAIDRLDGNAPTSLWKFSIGTVFWGFK